MNKKYKRVLVHFWTPRDKRLFYLKNVVLVAIIFALGILVGDGKIGFISSGSNGSLNNGLPNQLNYSSVNKVYQALKNNYDGKITQTEVLNGVKHGVAESVNDPYTEYFTAAEAKSFNG
jgi:C-terminal processing protease CtpA/Prc